MCVQISTSLRNCELWIVISSNYFGNSKLEEREKKNLTTNLQEIKS